MAFLSGVHFLPVLSVNCVQTLKVQFKVAAAGKTQGQGPKQDGNPLLNFSYGGFQQARGATLSSANWGSHGNRFYMEGALEFLDAEGEWHFVRCSSHSSS
jgi:hypothetical protein